MVEDVRKIVEKAWSNYVNGIHRSNAAAMATTFTRDAILLPPNVEMLRGRKAIEKYAEFQIKVGFKDAVFTTVEATKKDNTIYEVGNLTAKINPKEQAPFEEKLQYICVWKNTNSGWKAHRVIWNSAEPPPK